MNERNIFYASNSPAEGMDLPYIGLDYLTGEPYFDFVGSGLCTAMRPGGITSVFTDLVAGGGGGGGGGGLLAIWAPRWGWGRATIISHVACGRRRRRRRRCWRMGGHFKSFQWGRGNNAHFGRLRTKGFIKPANKVAGKSCRNKYDSSDKILNCQMISVRALFVDSGIYRSAIDVFISYAFLQSSFYQSNSFFCGLRGIQGYALLVVIMPLTSKRNEIVIVSPCRFNTVRGTYENERRCYGEINLESNSPAPKLVSIQILHHESHNADHCYQHCERDLQTRRHLFAGLYLVEIEFFVEIESGLIIHVMDTCCAIEDQKSIGGSGLKLLNGIIT